MTPDLGARSLAERFSPDTGLPLKLGEVWPPRPMIHEVSAKLSRVVVSVWFRHHLRHTVEIAVRSAEGSAEDPHGNPLEGLEVGRAAGVVDAGNFRRLALPIHWSPTFVHALTGCPWAVRSLLLELSDGRNRRIFQWVLYLTSGPPRLPEVTHHRWAGRGEVPSGIAATHWIELPPPLSAVDLPPACWVQDGPVGPERASLAAVFPVEPVLAAQREAVGWNGSLGGHDARPEVLPLAVNPTPAGEPIRASLHWWDTPSEGPSRPAGPVSVALGPAEATAWPVLECVDPAPRRLYDLGVDGGAVRVDVTVEVAEPGESLVPRGGTVRLGSEIVGRCPSTPGPLLPGVPTPLPCWIDPVSVARAASGIGGETSALKLSLHLDGRPARGPTGPEHQFRTLHGPVLELVRVEGGAQITPWVVIDLGSTATRVAVAFRGDGVPRVVPVLCAPSRTYFSPGSDGVYGLSRGPSDDALWTDDVLGGLVNGDGPHPACPDHVSATEVARAHLEGVLLELLERACWFPVASADVLVTFPVGLGVVPGFVAALRQTLTSIAGDLLWPDRPSRRLVFREAPLMAAIPVIGTLSPPAEGRRLVWVIDIGGDDVQVTGIPLETIGEPQQVGTLIVPALAHELTGRDLTRGFYTRLVQRLSDHGLNEGTWGAPLPRTPRPDPLDGVVPRHNQRVLVTLAEAVQATRGQDRGSIRQLARDRHLVLWSADRTEIVLADFLDQEVPALAELSIRDFHREVLEPRPATGHPGQRFYIRRFLAGCREALDAAVAAFPPEAAPDVVVVLIGSASRMDLLYDEAVDAFAPFPVHPGAEGAAEDAGGALPFYRTIGAGRFALASSSPGSADLPLSSEALVIDTSVFLGPLGEAPGACLASCLALSIGSSVPTRLEGGTEALGGDLVLRVPAPRGVPGDWIVIGRGQARRSDELRVGPETRLRTEAEAFVLDPCVRADGSAAAVRLARVLGDLPLLQLARIEER